MLIPIPTGVRHVVAVQGAVWKLVSCAGCRERFAYLLELEATGSDRDMTYLDGEASAQRARAQAEENLLQKSRNVILPVPCPQCGAYQDDMAQQLKDDASINRLQIAGAVIAAIAFIPLAIDAQRTWVFTVFLAVIGIVLLIRGCVVAFRFDPNSGDAEPRKALGRQYAVWGKQLDELLATCPVIHHDAVPESYA